MCCLFPESVPSERELVVDTNTKQNATNSRNDDDDDDSDKDGKLNNHENEHGTGDNSSQEGSLDVGSCCLCHCSLDYTDRAAFFRPDRMEDYNEETDNEDDYVFRPSDPYLPVELYDPSNALLYCDGCDRLYHQKCHFCPVVVIPRGEWHCLLCVYFSKNSNNKNKNNSKKKTTPKKKSSNNKTRNQKIDTDTSSTSSCNKKLYQQMYEAYTNKQLFVSPPVPAVKALEDAWEYESRHLKATYFQSHVLKRIRQYVESQASNYRLAETAVVTLTSTAKNRSHFFRQQSTTSSQELAQTLVKLYGIRKNWRQACYMLHDLQRATPTAWNLLQRECDKYEAAARNTDFVTRVAFPFGRQYERRVEPRTAEAKWAWTETNESSLQQQQQQQQPPQEIVVAKSNAKGKSKKSSRKAAASAPATASSTASTKRSSSSSQKAAAKSCNTKSNHDDDNDSGISLDDLQCCVCRNNEATDDNDLVLCDGQGCFRAFHAQCISPALKQADLEENVDWFCPYCSTLADVILSIQTIHMGDEWEQERYAAMIDNKKGTTATLTSTLQSWSHVEQVFPTAEQDYIAASQMKEGKRNKATDDLLARVLGVDALPDHDDDDEVEDGDFDLNSYQKQREELRKKKEQDDDDDDDNDDEASVNSNGDEESSHSSQATLVEMSSVELEVGKAELDALSKGSDDNGDDQDEEEEHGDQGNPNGRTRRSRRLRKSLEEVKNKELVDNIGDFDEANIVEGKRGRKPVDYIQLNQAIFGDVPDEDAVVLDDSEEFKEVIRKQSDANSASGSSDEDEDGSKNCDEVDDDDHDSRDDETENNSDASDDESIEKAPKKNGLEAKTSSSQKRGEKRKASTNGRNSDTSKKSRVNKKESASTNQHGPQQKSKPKKAKKAKSADDIECNPTTTKKSTADKKRKSTKKGTSTSLKVNARKGTPAEKRD